MIVNRIAKNFVTSFRPHFGKWRIFRPAYAISDAKKREWNGRKGVFGATFTVGPKQKQAPDALERGKGPI